MSAVSVICSRGSRFGQLPQQLPEHGDRLAVTGFLGHLCQRVAKRSPWIGVVIAAAVAEHELEDIVFRVLPPGVLVGTAVGWDSAELHQHGRDRAHLTGGRVILAGDVAVCGQNPGLGSALFAAPRVLIVVLTCGYGSVAGCGACL
jgi:hypothetical protein